MRALLLNNRWSIGPMRTMPGNRMLERWWVPRVGRALSGREQFNRQSYFVRDKDSTSAKPVFNRTIGLCDTFAKEIGKG